MIGLFIQWLRSNLRFVLFASLFVVIGIALSATYGTVVQHTNTLNFCAHSCHELESTVYQEYTQSKHFKNDYGVVVACPQCHAPQNDWLQRMTHNILAIHDVWSHWIGRVDTTEKFEAHRLELANRVWDDFKKTNARECKNCHAYSNMVLENQRPSVRAQHTDAMKIDENCLDCHKGLAHKKVQQNAAPDPTNFEIN